MLLTVSHTILVSICHIFLSSSEHLHFSTGILPFVLLQQLVNQCWRRISARLGEEQNHWNVRLRALPTKKHGRQVFTKYILPGFPGLEEIPSVSTVPSDLLEVLYSKLWLSQAVFLLHHPKSKYSLGAFVLNIERSTEGLWHYFLAILVNNYQDYELRILSLQKGVFRLGLIIFFINLYLKYIVSHLKTLFTPCPLSGKLIFPTLCRVKLLEINVVPFMPIFSHSVHFLNYFKRNWCISSTNA